MPATALTTHDPRPDAVTWKPLLRGWLHLVWFEACLVLGTIVVMSVDAFASPGCSDLRRVLRRTVRDECAVSPWNVATAHAQHVAACRSRDDLRLDRRYRYAGVLDRGPASVRRRPARCDFDVTAVALVIHMLWMDAPEWLVGSTFIALGCTGVAALPEVWVRAGVAPFLLFLAGGLLYILGAVLYRLAGPNRGRPCSASTRCSTPSCAARRHCNISRSCATSSDRAAGAPSAADAVTRQGVGHRGLAETRGDVVMRRDRVPADVASDLRLDLGPAGGAGEAGSRHFGIRVAVGVIGSNPNMVRFPWISV